MAACIMPSEYERRTYIKQIGEFQLCCDRIWYMGDETEISPEEEAEALGVLHGALEVFKKHLFLHSLRKTAPIRVETESKKLIIFGVSETYWDAWQAEVERRDKEEDEIEAAKMAQLEQKEDQKKT
ncbi:hypothetical protein BGZ82_001298 [Podila clonocystis]|nr:hypothetical protein BGZ82_001298 [Podila clonocystis]